MRAYKIITGMDNVQSGNWFRMTDDGAVRTRQATFVKPRTRSVVRSNFFSNRTTDELNMVPEEIKMLRTAGHC
jgi:hypothetical protein